ncbi:hypothetical protein D9756_000776 [Leucocoprinus leucothites]|uniref:DNA replication checkpoint mediator MRC1 domain-containing protein n=1 Tax=Leucocoprinus leucothites TaxID=201217 RepID=A0A8H5LP42_9AGAR|nr:hypothetical protein D9756_000776 [Leucoagaricus leucothites]
MGISKDFSIVADSEMASSPRPSASSPAPKLPIRRPARTYGRRREDLDNSFTSEQDSRDSILLTGPPNLSDEVPPSEPSGLLDSDEREGEDEDILPSSLTNLKTGFGWKEKMLEIDGKDDLSEYLAAQDAVERASDQDFPPTTPAVMDADHESPHIDSTTPSSPNALLNGISGGSLSLLTSSSQPPSSRRPPARVSALKATRDRRRTRRTIITSDDDIHDEDKFDDRLSSPQSPSPHLLATPNSHRTSSPPTSYHDHASGNSASSSASKGKGKALKVKSLVAPFSLEMNAHTLESVTRPRSNLSQGEKKRQKLKPPTKKERREIARERARLAAGQEVSIDKPVTEERSIRTLLNFVQTHTLKGPQRNEGATPQQPSSPIHDFSSSQPPTTRKPVISSSRKSPTPERSKAANEKQQAVGDSDSDGLPEIGTFLKTIPGKPADEGPGKERALHEYKLRVLQAQTQPQAADDSPESDLEVIPPTKLEQQRKSAEKKKMSHGQRMFLTNAHPKTKPLGSKLRSVPKKDLDAIQAVISKNGISDPMMFQAITRLLAERESLGIVKQKEELWKQLGGIVKEQKAGGSTDGDILNQIQKGLDAWTKQGEAGGLADEDFDNNSHGEEEEDPDWSPDTRGSLSPTSKRKEDEYIDYEKMEIGEMDDGDLENQEVGEADSDGDQSDDENDQVPAIKVKSKRCPRVRVVESDHSDAEEYIDENVSAPKPRDNHYVVSSSDDRTEDENDKENNTRLMFDRGEDKENKAVARHEPLSRRLVFDDMERDRSPSPSHGRPHNFEREDQDSSQNTASPSEKRQPFGVISDASPLSIQRQSSTLTQAFAEQLKHSSPTRVPIEDNEEGDVFGSTPSAPAGSLDFAPVFGSGNAGKDKKPAPLGFSQFSQDGSGSMTLGIPALLQPGFSDLFDSSTQKDGNAGVQTQGPRRQESLGLTQDLVLQPALQVDDKLLRRANAIFEKEQEYVVEAAGKKTIKQPQYYVNEVGLLTQTKPSTSRLGTRSPSLFLSPTQTRTQQTPADGSLVFTQPRTQQSQRRSSDATQRAPLSTISLSDPALNSPESSPRRRRIYRRGATPASPTHESSIGSPAPSNTLIASPPSHHRLDAFELLRKGVTHVKAKEKLKAQSKESDLEKALRKEYLNDEAEESDEEKLAGFGFGVTKGGDDEAEGTPGEDLDAPLAELMDDQKMDEGVVAADRVWEKHQELMDADDKKIEELHQRAVQGDLRRKRKKNGLGMDDSDDEDEEEDGKLQRMRKRMRPKTERGDIQALASSEDTAAFAKTYQSALVDDDVIETRPLDFEHDFKTGQELKDEDVVMDDNQEDEQENAEDGSDAEDEDKEMDKNNYVTWNEIREKARKMNEQPEEVDVRNYNDSSWIDEQLDASDGDGDDSLRVSLVKNSRKKASVPTTSTSTTKPEWDSVMLGGLRRRKESEKDVARSLKWAKQESRNTHGSTGRKVGGIAVTGHGNKTKSGGGSLRSMGSSASIVSSVSTSSSNLDGKKPLKAEGSVLAKLGRRDFQ